MKCSNIRCKNPAVIITKLGTVEWNHCMKCHIKIVDGIERQYSKGGHNK